MTFGSYLQQLQERTGEPLTRFLRRAEVRRDVWARAVEGEALPKRATVEAWLCELGVPAGSSEWHRALDLLCIANRQIPSDVIDHPALAGALGALRRRPQTELELDAYLHRLRRLTPTLPEPPRRQRRGRA